MSNPDLKYIHFMKRNVYRLDSGQPFGLYWTKSIQYNANFNITIRLVNTSQSIGLLANPSDDSKHVRVCEVSKGHKEVIGGFVSVFFYDKPY